MEGPPVNDSNAHLALATRGDVGGMLEIYRPVVDNSHTSFEYDVPTAEEFWLRVEKNLEHLPWLVYREDGIVKGYAYAVQFRTRIAYSWTCELSVYVREGFRKSGVGRKLYLALLDMLEWQGVRNFYGVIALPNEGSELFHRKLGFKKIALLPSVGYKERWIDMAWYLKKVGDDSPPDELRSMHELSSSGKLAEVCSAYGS